MNKLRFYFFHLMPYPRLPPTAEFPKPSSFWVGCISLARECS